MYNSNQLQAGAGTDPTAKLAQSKIRTLHDAVQRTNQISVELDSLLKQMRGEESPMAEPRADVDPPICYMGVMDGAPDVLNKQTEYCLEMIRQIRECVS